MAAEATGPQFAGGRWRSAKILAALLAIVLGAQLLVLAKLELVGPALPEPVQLASPASLDDPIAPSRAPRGYDLTIYVFSDYQCPSCRLLHPDLEHAVTADGHIRLVYKDWVVFGDRSRRAARLAIAAQWQGRHGAMNDLLMRGATGLDDAAMAEAATRSGVGWRRLLADLAAHRGDIDASLARTEKQSRLLNIAGTPALVVGDLLFVGRLGADQISQAIALARSGKIEPANTVSMPATARTGG
jgi:protein-disulfide isomerase